MSAPKRNFKHERVVGFASCELILDILYTMSTNLKMDMESVWIVVCVMQNTYRDLVTDPTLAVHLAAKDLPDATRLCMSRRAIADKTGLSRETVRRRTNQLIEAGLLEEVNSAVRISIRNDAQAGHGVKSLNEMHLAVTRYMKRIEEFDITMPIQSPPRPT